MSPINLRHLAAQLREAELRSLTEDMKTQQFFGSLATLILFACLSVSLVSAATESGSWVGLIKKDDAQNVSFVSGGKTYRIAGDHENELLRYDSQRVRLSGQLMEQDGYRTIVVSSVEAFSDEQRVPAVNKNRSDGSQGSVRMNMAGTDQTELNPNAVPADGQ